MKQDLIHKMFVVGANRYPFTTAGRARTVRRELYVERSRLQKAAPDSELTKLANDLQFRIEGCVLIVEPLAVESVDTQVADMLKGAPNVKRNGHG